MKQQKGFGHLALLLAFVVLALVGGASYYVYSKQNSKNKSTEVAVVETPATPKEKPLSDTIAELDKQLQKYADNQNVSEKAKFKLESIDSNQNNVLLAIDNKYEARKPEVANSKSYRTNRVSTDFASYNEYLTNHENAALSIAKHAYLDLGFSKVDEHTEQGQAEKYSYILFSKGTVFCQVSYASLTFIDIGCVETAK